MFQPPRCEKEQLSGDLCARSERGVSTGNLGLGAAKRHWVHRWVLRVAPSRARPLVDRCDLEDGGRDIPYGVVTDQIISWVSSTATDAGTTEF